MDDDWGYAYDLGNLHLDFMKFKRIEWDFMKFNRIYDAYPLVMENSLPWKLQPINVP